MPRPPKTKIPAKNSTASLGFEADFRPFSIRHSAFVISSALPVQLFFSMQIPVCLWFLAKNEGTDTNLCFRDRREQTLFIDAHKLGTLIDRVPSLN